MCLAGLVGLRARQRFETRHHLRAVCIGLQGSRKHVEIGHNDKKQTCPRTAQPERTRIRPARNPLRNLPRSWHLEPTSQHVRKPDRNARNLPPEPAPELTPELVPESQNLSGTLPGTRPRPCPNLPQTLFGLNIQDLTLNFLPLQSSRGEHHPERKKRLKMHLACPHL